MIALCAVHTSCGCAHTTKSKKIIKISERVASYVDKSLFILDCSAANCNFVCLLCFIPGIVMPFAHFHSGALPWVCAGCGVLWPNIANREFMASIISRLPHIGHFSLISDSIYFMFAFISNCSMKNRMKEGKKGTARCCVWKNKLIMNARMH